MSRTILHCDLNNFYASVECLYNPGIRNKPVVVCGSQSTRHGIVLAKNYIAKKYNVKTGEPIWEAKRKCPGLIAVKPNYMLYLKFSEMAFNIYKRYTDMIEPFGIDECWLDVTGSTRLFGKGAKIAFEIKEQVRKELGITASVGVSYNKIFAKLGSDIKKPDAVTVIDEKNFKSIIWPLSINNLMYVGHSTMEKLNKSGIFSIGQLARVTPSFLIHLLGKWGETLWIFANGYDDTPVEKAGNKPLIKSVGNSLTTPRDLVCNEEVKILFYVLSDSVAQRLRRHNLKGKTVRVLIKASDMESIERQEQLPHYTFVSTEIAEKAFKIFLKCWDWEKNIRLLGVRVSSLVESDSYLQLSFFDDNRNTKKQLLEWCMDKIRARYGHYSVHRALLLTGSNQDFFLPKGMECGFRGALPGIPD
jgi:DNA polymerase-4